MDREEILELAEQSKLELTEEEIDKLIIKFNTLFDKYKALDNIDIEDIEPLFSPLEDKIVNRFLKDEIKNISEEKREKILDREKMLDDFYQVPNKEGN